MFPDDRRYTRDHEWLRAEGDLYVLGITSFAQEELGEIVFLELPDVGSTHETGDEVGSIESVKAVAELFTPVPGEVVEVNEAAVEDPAVVNDDPHGAGWLVKLRVDDASAVDGMMDAAAYGEFTESGKA